jgi:FkbM family methyltransferase
MSEGFETTNASLGDEHSRRALLDVLKLRVLGPHHSPLAITPEAYRAKQAHVDRELRTAEATYEVRDPWFSPLSLYSVPVDGGATIALHSHSVDIVSVFLLGQYGYRRGGASVHAEPGDVVFDAGGCWGDTALYFAALVGPEGKVYTFEFDPENLEIMRANLALNPELAPRIEIVERALWDRSGEELRFAQAGRMTTVVGERRSEAPPVPTVTIDDFVEQHGVERLDFIKMDVEGAELKVIRGAGGSIARFAPKLAIAAYHRDDDLVTIPEAIAAVDPDYRLFLDSFSPVEEETVVFGARPRAASPSS